MSLDRSSSECCLLFYICSFSGLAAHYKDLHLSDFDDSYLESSTDRMSPTAKRITEGWLTYSLVEIMQRYNIRGKFSFLGALKY